MPDTDGMKEAKNYYLDKPQQTEGFFLKGSNSLDWGMKNRLARIFNPKSGRTVMLAIDHGYFQGPTTGLERIDVDILPLVPYADTLMLTRGILRSIVPASTNKSIVLRASGGTSILSELSNEDIAVDIEESIRLNVCAMAVQVFIGGEYERQSISNMTTMVDWGATASTRPAPSNYGPWPLPPWVRIWHAMRAISGWQPASAPNWALTMLNPTISKRVSRRLSLPVRYRSSWPAEKRYRNSMPSTWPTTRFNRVPAVWTWGATSFNRNLR